MLYHLKLGGISVKPQSLTVTCLYTEEGRSPLEIIRGSFGAFLKNELPSAPERGRETAPPRR